MVLAQDTDILFFDEPTNHLDIKYQLEILHLLKRLNKERKKTIVLVLHDINLSLRFADRLFILKEGELFASGSPDILTKELMLEVFKIKSEILPSPLSKNPMCFFY